jgi:SHS2 domain-containing protein
MSDPRFRLVETTADVGLLVWGKTDGELFCNAAAGLFRVLATPRGVGSGSVRTVSVRGLDEPARLVAWLSDWLYLFDAEGFIGRTFMVDTMEGDIVTGRGWGDSYDPGRHQLLSEVKGITYHGLEISRDGPRIRARLVLDV